MPSKTVPQLNVVALVGILNRPPQLRVLKSGESVVNLDVQITANGSRSDVLPVSWFDAPAWVFDLAEGDSVAVFGRMRRQWFAGRSNFTDVVADQVMPARSTAKVRRAFGAAMATLQEAAP